MVRILYLGGLAIGAFWVAEAAKKLRAPLLWYAGAE